MKFVDSIYIVTKSCRSNCADFVTNLQLTSCSVNSENFQTGNPFQVSPSTRKNHLRGRDKENFPFFFFLLSMYNNPEAIASPPYISPHSRCSRKRSLNNTMMCTMLYIYMHRNVSFIYRKRETLLVVYTRLADQRSYIYYTF
ncbi:unnamed protein product [Aphis gossypii]|uniref:Uncharacterized protein n=1 Tax=Aphis gossypii TaxID=80765 RepID=A0A9P0NHI1_APHGO|nr:unnamed protein product [Aphis gossypii]